MPMEKHQLEKILRDGLPHAKIRVEDLRGDGDHYKAYISSPTFAGLSRVQQHQQVYAALGTLMGGELHALSLVTSEQEFVD